MYQSGQEARQSVSAAGSSRALEPFAAPSAVALDAKRAAPAASFGGFDPIEATRHDVVITGPSSNRVDVWFVGDGYTADQLDLLLADVAAQWSWMTADAFAEPFGAYADLFNVHVLFAASAEAGADRPDDGVYVDTAFGASYSWQGGPERLLYFDAFAVDDALAGVLGGDDADMRFGVVNDDQYGGGGDSYAVYAAGAEEAPSLALHEAGHAYVGLADEYWAAGDGAYQGGRPAANISADPDDVPWAHWIGYDDGVLGPIGAFEGGAEAETGVFRPTEDSLMRTLGRPFDAVAREAFVLAFYEAVDPLDAWSFAGEGALTDVYAPFWIDTISDALIDQAWSVNGEAVGTEAALDLTTLDLAPGRYEVAVRAYDDSPFVRHGRDALEQTVTWDVTLSYRARNGTAAAERLEGTADPDRIDAGGGDDVLVGGSGDDLLFGGAGDDVIYGDDGSADGMA